MTPDESYNFRAALGRAFGIWSGGLDGPAPSEAELIEHAGKCARIGQTMRLDRLRTTVAAMDSATSGKEAIAHIGWVLDAARKMASE